MARKQRHRDLANDEQLGEEKSLVLKAQWAFLGGRYLPPAMLLGDDEDMVGDPIPWDRKRH